MGDDFVALPTSLDPTAVTGRSFQYFLDLTGVETLQTALRFLRAKSDPNAPLELCLRCPDGSRRWLDPELTLRDQGVAEGNLLILQPRPKSDSAPPSSAVQSTCLSNISSPSALGDLSRFLVRLSDYEAIKKLGPGRLGGFTARGIVRRRQLLL
jgi:hypothetical protein